MTSSPTRTSGFTLIELLAVIAIIAIAMAVAIPSLIGMTRGSGMNASVTELKAVMSLARQWAISHRENTYVVFPDGGHYGTNTNRGDLAYHSFAVWGEKSQEYIREWSFLKTGVYFIPRKGKEAGTNHSQDTKNPFNASLGRLSVDFPETSDPSVDLPAIGFRPDGRAFSPAGNTLAPLELYLGEGLINAAVGRGDIDESDLKFKPESTVFGIEANRFTGGLRVRDYQSL